MTVAIRPDNSVQYYSERVCVCVCVNARASKKRNENSNILRYENAANFYTKNEGLFGLKKKLEKNIHEEHAEVFSVVLYTRKYFFLSFAVFLCKVGLQKPSAKALTATSPLFC